MTTNGVYLADQAGQLKAAGLDRVNISLDTLKKERFERITGVDAFDAVRRGLEAALESGFGRVKLNVILMRGVNDDEITDFAALAVKLPLAVRFIEYFHTNSRSGALSGALVPTEEVKKAIAARFGPLSALVPAKRGGPAQCFKLEGAAGELGFISNHSDNFCSVCNRLRMDRAGKVYPCLFAPATHELKTLLRSGADARALAEQIGRIFAVKSAHRKDTAKARNLEMSHIGG